MIGIENILTFLTLSSEVFRANSMARRCCCDRNKSRACSSLRKRFEANLSGRSWRQYRLRNFENYLKLSLLFSLSLSSSKLVVYLHHLLLLFPNSSFCPLGSTHLQLQRLFPPRPRRNTILQQRTQKLPQVLSVSFLFLNAANVLISSPRPRVLTAAREKAQPFRSQDPRPEIANSRGRSPGNPELAIRLGRAPLFLSPARLSLAAKCKNSRIHDIYLRPRKRETSSRRMRSPCRAETRFRASALELPNYAGGLLTPFHSFVVQSVPR